MANRPEQRFIRPDPLDRRQRLALTLRPYLPKGVRRVVRRAAWAFDPIEVALYRRKSGEQRPIPPRELRERNAVYSVSYWYTAAEEVTGALEAVLARHGKRIEDFGRVLDFGCGAGKAESLLHDRTELHACDQHGPSAEWIAKAYPNVRAAHTDYDPPLPYPDRYFDLLFAWSVLTHLDRDRQRQWLAEWARVVKPGGTIIATILGASMLPADNEDARAAVEREGVLYIDQPKDGAATSWFHGTSKPYGDTFNSHDSIPELLPEGTELVEIVERAAWGQQDAVVLQRR